MYMQLTNSCLLFSDTLAWIFRGNNSTLGYYMVRISNFLVFLLGYVIMLLFTRYLFYQIPEERRKDFHIEFMIINVISIVAILMTIISQFNNMYYYFDENNFYCRNSMFWLSQVFGILGMIIEFILLVKSRKLFKKNKFIALISYVILPIIALIIQIFLYGIALLNSAITISILFVFVTTQIEQSRLLVEHERKLHNMQTEIMISQISPHFIFNSLTTIKYLCRNKPDEAVQAVEEFSMYLRGNLDALVTNKCIPIEKELEHIENYLSLEKKRFGDKINVVMNIKESDFEIPALTLQPLVENAIKHGITKKVEGGMITITTEDLINSYIITIHDDGVGFDTSVKKNDGKSHIGIENVRTRLKNISNGTLEIISKVGKGTSAIITLPKYIK